MKPRVSVIVTDLDNTLFDWVDIWYQPFKAMLDALSAESGIPTHILERDFKAVFQKHGTSEYAFAIEELTSLRDKHPIGELTEIYAGAIQIYREIRRNVLRLYPTVKETLEKLRTAGCLLIAYTESMEFYTKYRMRKLGLDHLLDYMYSPRDHVLPRGLTPEQIRFYSSEHYELAHVVQSYTPEGELKPNPKVLSDILASVGARREETAYVGDSLMKDIVMAQGAGVYDVWAKYGVAQNREAYELLRRITHWPESIVSQEKALREADVMPSVILSESFDEILKHFEIGRVRNT